MDRISGLAGYPVGYPAFFSIRYPAGYQFWYPAEYPAGQIQDIRPDIEKKNHKKFKRIFHEKLAKKKNDKFLKKKQYPAGYLVSGQAEGLDIRRPDIWPI